MIQNVEKNKCTGCKMCGDICPTKAIEFIVDDKGFWYPNVDEDKCIKCGLCTNRCIAINSEVNIPSNEPQIYSAWNKDDAIRVESTSGGVYHAIAKRFLEIGGYIAGAIYGEDNKSAYHIVTNEHKMLKKIMGSKYFQSDSEGIYIKIKKLLENGEKVLFCGTPCQNVALSNYLNKEYKTLFYVDFICRGINSPKAFYSYVSELEEEYGSKVERVNLKNKKTGWQSLATYIKFENGKEYHKDKFDDLWVKGFVSVDLYMRDSCHNCQYRKIPRVQTDVTIGDFWCIENQTDEDLFKGISVIMVNTDKGVALMEEIKDLLFMEKHTIDEVLPGNSALLYDQPYSKKTIRFFKLLEKYPFSEAVKKCLKESFIRKVLRKIKHIIT